MTRDERVLSAAMAWALVVDEFTDVVVDVVQIPDTVSMAYTE